MMFILGEGFCQSCTSSPCVNSDSSHVGLLLNSNLFPDTINLESITVSAKYPDATYLSAYRIPLIEIEAHEEKTLGEMLQKVTPIYLKDYGPGNTSTITLRGTNASQTQIYWNGVPINAAGTGQTDFSTIPVMSGDEILILPGLVSLEKGSGGLGGSIEINNNPRWNENNHCEANIETGSFGYQSYGGKAAIRYKTLQSKFYTRFQSADNDFEYINNTLAEPRKEKRVGASNHQWVVGEDFYLNTDSLNSIEIHLFTQSLHRDIPSPISTVQLPENEKMKLDDARIMASWRHQSKNQFRLGLKSAWTYNYMNYQNKLATINSTYTTHQGFLIMNASKYWKNNTRLESEIRFQSQVARTANYANNINRNITSLWIKLNHHFGSFVNLYAGMRKEIAQSTSTPLLPIVGAELFPTATKNLAFYMAFAKNSRIPVLNDLYWVPGGNPNLKPEISHHLESGLRFQQNLLNRIPFSLQMNTYSSRINDWIAWMPDSVMISIWKPFNLKHVKANGLEILMDIGYTWSKISLNSRLSYAFNITNEENEENHQERQLQLPYTPQHIGNFSLHLVHHSFGFIYSMNYTGKRFSQYDRSHSLKPYLLQDASFIYHLSIKKYEIKLTLKIYNLLNIQWENIAYQPMPGRYFHLGFTFLLNH